MSSTKTAILRSSQRYCWSPSECDAVWIDVFIFGVGLHGHEHEDTTIIRNVSNYPPNDTVPLTTTLQSSNTHYIQHEW